MPRNRHKPEEIVTKRRRANAPRIAIPRAFLEATRAEKKLTSLWAKS